MLFRTKNIPSQSLSHKNSNWKWLASAFLLLPIVAIADYLTGFEFQFSIFYLVSVYLATWFRGWQFGVFVSLISIVLSLLGDLANGAVFRQALVPWWNCVIGLGFHLAVVYLLHRLRSFQRQLEDRVSERTLELREEIQERRRVEEALLEVSEREQRRIGHDLHDSLCQHLTSAALAGQVLSEKLRQKGLSEAEDSDQMIEIVENGIDLARSLARGLAPVELDALGLVATLRELVRTTSLRSRIQCSLETSEDVQLDYSEAVVHLFRIAQEAISNAVRHSEASKITVSLRNEVEGLEMKVRDDGRGMPSDPVRRPGMGLHIMRHRASMIGAVCRVITVEKGTCVSVLIPSKLVSPISPSS